MDYKSIAPWELLQKKMVWEHLKFIRNQRVLDFGSGTGMTANHFAKGNEVIAIEPDEKMLSDRFVENDYVQIKGYVKELRNFTDESFDVVLCHNVLEYVTEREEILKEFSRILKIQGYLSILKHNKPGRVMQMVVLLNNFEHANGLLDGKNGHAKQFGTINYYEDTKIMEWSDEFELKRIFGVRTFWDLQQNQEIHNDQNWQEQMLEIELKVSEIEEYKAIASFHHVILRKK